jgi:uncharacterized protein YaeQ
VSAKYSFRLSSEIKTHPLPGKILIGQHPLESSEDVILKLLARVIFSRDRLQLEPRYHDDNIPFVPSLLQLDYQLRPALWVECGDCPVAKIDKLAVKAHEAEIWIVLRSAQAVERLVHEMAKHDLRRNRYHLLGFDEAMVEEMNSLLTASNTLSLFHLNLREPMIQFEFNGLWFDAALKTVEF